MNISDKLKQFIREHNVDQKELARISGVTEGAVSQWLSGSTLPKIGRLQKITQHFGLPISALIDDEATNAILSYNGSDKRIIEADDFIYTLYEESKDLTEEQKEALLAMAKAFKKSK